MHNKVLDKLWYSSRHRLQIRVPHMTVVLSSVKDASTPAARYSALWLRPRGLVLGKSQRNNNINNNDINTNKNNK